VGWPRSFGCETMQMMVWIPTRGARVACQSVHNVRAAMWRTILRVPSHSRSAGEGIMCPHAVYGGILLSSVLGRVEHHGVKRRISPFVAALLKRPRVLSSFPVRIGLRPLLAGSSTLQRRSGGAVHR
jgi:hypothetical protein